MGLFKSFERELLNDIILAQIGAIRARFAVMFAGVQPRANDGHVVGRGEVRPDAQGTDGRVLADEADRLLEAGPVGGLEARGAFPRRGPNHGLAE